MYFSVILHIFHVNIFFHCEVNLGCPKLVKWASKFFLCSCTSSKHSKQNKMKINYIVIRLGVLSNLFILHTKYLNWSNVKNAIDHQKAISTEIFLQYISHKIDTSWYLNGFQGNISKFRKQWSLNNVLQQSEKFR